MSLREYQTRAQGHTERTMSRKQGSSFPSRRKYTPKPVLRGETFYLDVKRKNRINKLEEAIILLGGKIDRFLNKHVTCVVIDRPLVRRTSPRFHPSRGQAMLQNVKPLESSVSSSDVMRNAKNWKIPVKTFDEFKEWLKELKAGHKDSDEATEKKAKVRRLRGAFIKVEDRSRKYRPLVKEMKSWPRPNLNAKPGTGPFDDVKIKRVRRSSTPATPTKYLSRKRLFRKCTLKKGYCELCGMEYEGVTKGHVYSRKHKKKASVPGKYSGVDRLINSGTSLRQFVEKVNEKQKKARAATIAKQQITEQPATPQTITIRRSARLIAAARLLEGSAYFTLPSTVTYTLPNEKHAG